MIEEFGVGTLRTLVAELGAQVKELRQHTGLPEKETLSVELAAHRLNVSTDRVRCLVSRGFLLAVLVGEDLRIPLAEIERLEASGPPQCAPPSAKELLSRLRDHLLSKQR